VPWETKENHVHFSYVVCYSYHACSYNQYIIQEMHFVIQHTWQMCNSNMFWHWGAIIREFLQQRCTSQPANVCFVHSFKHS